MAVRGWARNVKREMLCKLKAALSETLSMLEDQVPCSASLPPLLLLLFFLLCLRLVLVMLFVLAGFWCWGCCCVLLRLAALAFRAGDAFAALGLVLALVLLLLFSLPLLLLPLLHNGVSATQQLNTRHACVLSEP